METLPRSMHSPLISHKYCNFSRIKNMKSRQAHIVSILGISEGINHGRITKSLQHQHDIPIPMIMEQRRGFENTLNIPADSRKPSSELSLLENIFSTLDRAIIKFIDPPLHLSVDPSYILCDNFAPVDELSPTECEVVHGFIPACLDGVYIRNGPNPQFPPSGPHHYLDGDGMVHSVRIHGGQATLCSRYVKTNKFVCEHQVKSYIVPNIIGGMQGLGSFVARAAVFAARVVSGHYDIGKGHHDFDGKLRMNMTAHSKIDPETKEAFSFRYWGTRPYLTYFRFDANGNKQPDVPILSMKQPSLTHDLAITKKYAIIFDIQLGADPMNLIRGRTLVSVDPKKVPRIGVLPRYAKDESDMKWFEVPGFNIFHAVNAWDEIDEDGGEVVVLVAPNILTVEHFLDRVDLIQASMEKVTIHFRTGIVSRETLSTDNLEFTVINPACVAKMNKYFYAAISEKTPIESRMMRTIGVAKLDIEKREDNTDVHDHTVARRIYGDNCFGGEPFFVSREPKNPNSKEDDGYLVSFVHNESLGESRFLVMDAQSHTLEIVAEVKLPQRVPYGLHGIFVRDNDLNKI
ncbi:unnamed protein product [Lactuca saligna]|uniref:9-cis-epoxycarotenoid dioxygenase n=1 Tax=Lactuca saligna TaxID=75948 RepID=A0AA35Y2T2_LACSI|nr:unnamed protein product [Lactuca saligna]